VGPTGFEPMTFAQDDAMSVFAGFFKTAPEIRHPFRSANPLVRFLEPAVLTRLDYDPTVTPKMNKQLLKEYGIPNSLNFIALPVKYPQLCKVG
jgi:hypothetical protein